MRTFIDSLKARKAAASEGGFSLIDVVVTVAIIVALSVGGFIAYTGLVHSAKEAATSAAADQVYTAVLVATNDGGELNSAEVVTNYNKSSNGVDITAAGGLTIAADGTATGTWDGTTVTATHDDSAGAGDLVVTRGN